MGLKYPFCFTVTSSKSPYFYSHKKCSLPEIFKKVYITTEIQKIKFDQACIFIKKKRPWHRCFPVNFTKFPRAPPVAASLFNPIQREAKFAITVVKNKQLG